PNPCQRDIVPLESHFSTNDYIERAENRFFALFVLEHAKRIKSFGQAFSKACGVQRRRLWSLSADSETPSPSKTQERVNLIAEQSKRGNPNEGFPLKTERREVFCGGIP
ncbi:MAG: hypothetical protein MJ062_06965, partial [Oscillospiraceae bacterium]|nr:hypothetical protein [Oscillospiraceae bacterium]